MDDLKRLLETISASNGPTIQLSDVEWALDLPAGKKLVEWLSAQLEPQADSLEELPEEDRVLNIGVALRDIALESDEVNILKHIGTSGSVNPPANAGTPAAYVPPSRLRKHAECMDKETCLLEQEANTLKIRIQQTKLASQKVSQTIKDLQSAISQEDVEIDQLEERLSDLSLRGDTAISSTVNTALLLLNGLGCQPGPESEVDIEANAAEFDAQVCTASAISSLSQLASIRSALIDHRTVELDIINDASERLPTSEEVRAEAGLLHDALNGRLVSDAEEAVFLRELSDLCDLLDSGDVPGGLSEMVVDYGTDNEYNLDVRGELEKAWSLDQAALLERKSELLDATISSYKANVLDPLTDLHKSLTTVNQQNKESEALIGALGMELEDVVDDVRTAKENSKIDLLPTKGDEALEEHLKSLLKNMKGMRPPDAPPLALLQRSDTLEELRAIVERVRNTQDQDESWSKDLPLNLSQLRDSTRARLLTKVYEHSPLNTSPPLALPPKVLKLQEEAKHKGEDLQSNVGRLQKELEVITESSRTKRKLGAFIDKWSRGAR